MDQIDLLLAAELLLDDAPQAGSPAELSQNPTQAGWYTSNAVSNF
jgi:hypothetical protein